MLVTYALEQRSTWYILGFAAACMLGSIYGFLQGAWPFGVVEAVWSIVALERWMSSIAKTDRPPRPDATIHRQNRGRIVHVIWALSRRVS